MFRIGGPFPDNRFEGNIVFGSAPNGALPAGGFVRIDPGLVRDGNGVFKLKSGTGPSVNVAVGDYPEVTVDMDGQPRKGTKHIGADEISPDPIIAKPLKPADVGPGAP